MAGQQPDYFGAPVVVGKQRGELEDGWYTVQSGGVQVLNERGRQALIEQQGITYGADDLPVGVFVVAQEGEDPFVQGESFDVTVHRAPIDIHIQMTGELKVVFTSAVMQK